MAGGRPTGYNKEIANTICKRLSNGESLASICRDAKMPARSTVHYWLIDHQEFLDKYEVAREIQADVYADEMENIAIEEKDVQRARLRIDTRKWIASKLKPKRYGDKLDMTTQGEKIQPLMVKIIGKE